MEPIYHDFGIIADNLRKFPPKTVILKIIRILDSKYSERLFDLISNVINEIYNKKLSLNKIPLLTNFVIRLFTRGHDLNLASHKNIDLLTQRLSLNDFYTEIYSELFENIPNIFKTKIFISYLPTLDCEHFIQIFFVKDSKKNFKILKKIIFDCNISDLDICKNLAIISSKNSHFSEKIFKKIMEKFCDKKYIDNLHVSEFLFIVTFLLNLIKEVTFSRNLFVL